MIKHTHVAFCLLLALTTRSYAIEADDPASCRHLIDELPASDNQSHEQSVHAIELLVWNVQKFENPSALKWLKETHSHIILTQESIASVQQKFAGELKATNTFAPGYRTFNNETSGVGIVTTLETLMSCAWQHKEPWLLTPKATLVSALRTADQVMIAVNLHAVNFSVGTQELQDQLDAISKVIAQYNGPILVAGDFNTWSQARTEVLERFIQQHDLTAAKFEPDHRVRPFSYPLDHILTKNLKVVAAQSEHSELSDHAPLIMTINATSVATPKLTYKHKTKIERYLAER
jgi:endonuclease/exonuclease/phosphatase (EEP) superfamily protein YafD